MKLYNIILLLGALITLNSCEKLLDKEPVDKISIEELFKDVPGARTALAGAYHQLLESSQYNRNLMVYPDLLGGNIKFSTTVNPRLDDIYNVIQTPTESSMNETYTGAYSALNNVNNILKYVPAAIGSDAEKAKIIAEARSIRALLHFNLLRIYAQPINFSSEGTHPGIVINTAPRLFSDSAPMRQTVADSYKQIVSDLREALAVFDDANSPTLSGNKQYFFTASSARALLAKVYLYQQNWDQAFALADELIKSNQYSLIPQASYVASWEATSPGTESIFELAIEPSSTGTSLGSYYSLNDNSYRMYAATNDLRTLYSSTDIRSTASLYNSMSINGTTYYFTKKYANGGASQKAIKILRLSEIYLIRAEAAVRKATLDLNQMNQDLNLIRRRADASAAMLNITDPQQALEAIFLERRKELAFEGNLLFDLSRFKKALTRIDVTATTPNLQANDDKMIMPIPATTVNANSEMIQNQGY